MRQNVARIECYVSGNNADALQPVLQKYDSTRIDMDAAQSELSSVVGIQKKAFLYLFFLFGAVHNLG